VLDKLVPESAVREEQSRASPENSFKSLAPKDLQQEMRSGVGDRHVTMVSCQTLKT